MRTQKLPTPLQTTQVFYIWIILVFLLWGTKLAFVKINNNANYFPKAC